MRLRPVSGSKKTSSDRTETKKFPVYDFTGIPCPAMNVLIFFSKPVAYTRAAAKRNIVLLLTVHKFIRFPYEYDSDYNVQDTPKRLAKISWICRENVEIRARILLQ